jgi:hypothetical protein
MNSGWRFLLIVFCIAATAVSLFIVYKGYERRHRAEHIQTELDALKVRSLDLKARFDKLAEDSAKAPNDPVILKELGTRHLKLVEENTTWMGCNANWTRTSGSARSFEMYLAAVMLEQIAVARRVVEDGAEVIPAWRITTPEGSFLILTRFQTNPNSASVRCS